jgi:membrane AbrB-like protein
VLTLSSETAVTASDPHPARGVRRRHLLSRARGVGLWTVVVVACYWLSKAGELAGVPAPELVLPLVAGAALALTGVVRSPFPKRVSRASQALVGVLMGSYLQPEAMRSVAVTALPLTVVTLATIAISVLAAALLVRTGKVGMTDAALGMVPGGSAAIIACSDDLGADSRQVAFTQYLRVGMVALAAPLVAVALGSDVGPESDGEPAFGWPAFGHLVEQPRGAASVLVLTAICLLGVRLGRRLRLPSPMVLGPMVLATVVTFTHTWAGFAPAGPFQDVLFAVIGLEVGLRFTRAGVRHVGAMLPYLLAAIVGMCLACAALAWLFGTLTGIGFVEAYLATTPGGINAVLATAVATHSDVPLVSTVQSLRLFVVVLAAPPIIRWLATRRAPATVPQPRQAPLVDDGQRAAVTAPQPSPRH